MEPKEIIKLWYSKVVLNFAQDETKRNFRKLENKMKKLINNEEHLNFNTICLKENLLPNYTDFRLHDAAARDERFVKKCKINLLER